MGFQFYHPPDLLVGFNFSRCLCKSSILERAALSSAVNSCTVYVILEIVARSVAVDVAKLSSAFIFGSLYCWVLSWIACACPYQEMAPYCLEYFSQSLCASRKKVLKCAHVRCWVGRSRHLLQSVSKTPVSLIRLYAALTVCSGVYGTPA